MKANELMIGDLVYYSRTEDGIAPYKEVICIKAEDLCRDACIIETHYKPIPLTQKILERNGFSYTKPLMPTQSEDMVWQYQNDEEQTLVEIEEQMDDNLNNYYILFACCGVNTCELYIHYTHELQHALRLCRIEKELVP